MGGSWDGEKRQIVELAEGELIERLVKKTTTFDDIFQGGAALGVQGYDEEFGEYVDVSWQGAAECRKLTVVVKDEDALQASKKTATVKGQDNHIKLFHLFSQSQSYLLPLISC